MTDSEQKYLIEKFYNLKSAAFHARRNYLAGKNQTCLGDLAIMRNLITEMETTLTMEEVDIDDPASIH